jgi:hypothetical protein
MDFFTRFPYRWNLSSNCGSWNRIERRACKKTFKFYLSRSLTVLFLIDLRQGVAKLVAQRSDPAVLRNAFNSNDPTVGSFSTNNYPFKQIFILLFSKFRPSFFTINDWDL